MTELLSAAKQELEWRKISADGGFKHFVNEYCYMWAKEGGDPIKWTLWDCQVEAAEMFDAHNSVICLKTRQIGLSWTGVSYVLLKVMTRPNFHAYVTSIGLKEVQEQVERVKFIYNNLPDWMQKRALMGGKGRKNNESLIQFSNNSAIHAVSSKRSSGHGSTPGLYLIDEFSRKENDYDSWRAIKPSLGEKSKVIIISTSDGRNNLFYDLWKEAELGNNNFYPLFLPASAHPDYTPERLAEIKLDFAHDPIGYMQAYPSSAAEAFTSSDKSVFDQDILTVHLENVIAKNIEPVMGFINVNGEFEESSTGNLAIWSPPKPGYHYTIGVDVALGVTGGDWSVIAVLCRETMEIVALYRAKIKPENYSYPIKKIGEMYNTAFVVVEINAFADAIMQDLKSSYWNLYTRQVTNMVYDKPTLEPGFRTTAVTKPNIITQLKKVMSDPILPLKIYSREIIKEMEYYEQDANGKLGAAKDKHDDCVIAVALAVEGLGTMPAKSAGFKRVTNEAASRDNMSWRSL